MFGEEGVNKKWRVGSGEKEEYRKWKLENGEEKKKRREGGFTTEGTEKRGSEIGKEFKSGKKTKTHLQKTKVGRPALEGLP